MFDWLRCLFRSGADARREHEWLLAAMTDLERRQLEAEATTAELEERVAILEGEHADDRVA